jgi:hypothetical protein
MAATPNTSWLTAAIASVYRLGFPISSSRHGCARASSVIERCARQAMLDAWALSMGLGLPPTSQFARRTQIDYDREMALVMT